MAKPIESAGLTAEQIGELPEYCHTIHKPWVEDGKMPQLEGFPETPRATQAAA